MSSSAALVRAALAEDIGSGDLTSRAVVPDGARAHATIVAKAPGVVAGLALAVEVFETVDPTLLIDCLRSDGDLVEAGSELIKLSGTAASILAGERVALNFLGHLSGIATLTAGYAKAVFGTDARILDTRKTTPGFRSLEKAAVVAGGGVSYRFGLYDAVLVKENHIRIAGGVGEATRLALQNAPNGKQVEVEVENLTELEEALTAGARKVLLDNMDPGQLRAAVEATAGRAELQASGGVTLDSVRTIAETGVDFISVGALTHSAPALDVSLLFEPE
jgi:nicotinate-nucleotide pyrophosphorylase (carboxylating)